MVDADDVSVRSGSVGVKTHRGTAANVAPILRVQVTGKVASGSFKARPPHRTFWQWLMRRPYVYG